MESANVDLSSWLPSAVLAGMLALFQGHDAPVPKRYIGQVRLAASVVLFTSAYLLYNEDSREFNPRKLNALMVFGFVLHHYFAPSKAQNKVKSYRRSIQNQNIPMAQALFRHHPINPRVEPQRDKIPDSWGMQVDGGQYLMGNKDGYKCKDLDESRESNSYVLEHIGSWSSAEQDFNEFRRKQPKPRKLYHSNAKIGQGHRYDQGKQSKNWDGMAGQRKRNTVPDELVIKKAIYKPETKKKVELSNDKTSKAMVQNLTSFNKPSVFQINPLDNDHVRMATKPLATGQKPACPGPFKINPIKIPGVNVSIEESKAPKDQPQAHDESPVQQKSPAQQEPPKNSPARPKMTQTLIRHRRSPNLNAKPFSAALQKKKPSHANATLPGGNVVLNQMEAEHIASIEKHHEHSTAMRRNSLANPKRTSGNEMRHRKKPIRRTRSIDIPQAQFDERDYSPVEEAPINFLEERHKPAMHAAIEPRVIRRPKSNLASIKNKREARTMDVWKDSFGDGYQINWDRRSSSERQKGGFAVETLLNNRTALFYGLLVLSHVGFYFMVQNFSQGAESARRAPQPAAGFRSNFNAPAVGKVLRSEAFDDKLYMKPTQTFVANQIIDDITNMNLLGSNSSGFLDQPILSGYVEAFLLFCLVKGTIDCVDRIYRY